MIKQKAPKDMTFEEGVAYVEKVFADGKKSGCYSDDSKYTFAELIEFLHRRLKEPAPNPFTPDQLATMRELQRNGMRFAAKDKCEEYWGFRLKPYKRTDDWADGGEDDNDRFPIDIKHLRFICDVLSWDDSEPLRFADYAPLEEKTNE